MTMLTEAQRASFWENGYLVVENAVSPEQLEALRTDFQGWVDESTTHAESYGTTVDGRHRFDLEPGHTATSPALRRVSAPIEVSEAYKQVAFDSAMVDAVTDLIGPNVKLHHTKVNSKLPGAATSVKWHQDFPFTPHSNDDLVTALSAGRAAADDVRDIGRQIEEFRVSLWAQQLGTARPVSEQRIYRAIDAVVR